MTKQASFRCEYCGTSYVYQQSLDMHLIGCSYRSKALAGQNVVKVYPKREQLEAVAHNLRITVENLNIFSESLDSDYKKESVAFYVDCLNRQIESLESLYISKA